MMDLLHLLLLLIMQPIANRLFTRRCTWCLLLLLWSLLLLGSRDALNEIHCRVRVRRLLIKT